MEFDCKVVKILLKVTFTIGPTTVVISIISTMITVPRNTTRKTETKAEIGKEPGKMIQLFRIN